MRRYAAQWGRLPAAERERLLAELTRDLSPRYRAVLKDYFNALSTDGVAKADEKLRLARESKPHLSDRLDLGASVQSVAAASSLGDHYQYVIDRPVDLARQKSALLPIVNKDVEGKRVSIYNPAVQPKRPLLGLRFKNTTGMPLTQGPVTVFEGSVYAGDTRVLDLQPDEERLVSYAVDLGTEFSTKPGNNTSRITSVKAVKGVVTTHTVVREERVYDVSNRRPGGGRPDALLDGPEQPGEAAKPTELVHLVAVYAADNSITFYRNGEMYGSPFTPGGDRPTLRTYSAKDSCIYIGTDHDSLNGEIEEARLYDRALTPEEVKLIDRFTKFPKR